MQYDAMIEGEKKLRRGEIERAEGGNQTWRQPDPTGNAAIGIAMKSNAGRIKAIEDATRAAGPGIYRWLLIAVTTGKKYEDMDVPCGRAQFYAARRRFFVELDARI